MTFDERPAMDDDPTQGGDSARIGPLQDHDAGPARAIYGVCDARDCLDRRRPPGGVL